MEELRKDIEKLEKINNAILSCIGKTKHLEEERINIIKDINNKCKNIKPIKEDEIKEFNDIIRLYFTIQQNYRRTENNLQITQLMMRYPNLTKEKANEILSTGKHKNILQLTNISEAYSYVKQRNEDVLKLEKSLQEVNELFIIMYTITEQQGTTIDNIGIKTEVAKNNVKYAKKELKDIVK